ncbi:DUF4913 domain-containing protein [Mumia qirimensis]|uniref:DUF4913 domain-containing protein n=1 Tax=Mumia qirimensis TaxID=3234852 RepID=UPI00351CCE1E
MNDIVEPRTGEVLDITTVEGLAQAAVLLDERTRTLAQMLDDAVATPAGVNVPSQWSWRGQSPHGTRTLWRGLAEWVGWLRGRYPLARQIPPCWWRHPELVEELTALWVAWREAYADPEAPMTSPIDWHDRWLPAFLRRIGAGGWNISCTDEHKERPESTYDARAVDDDEAFAEHITRESADMNDNPSQMSIDDVASPDATVLTGMQMRAAVQAGEAMLLGSLPGSPIAHRDHYWVPEGDDWIRVKDEATIAFLRDAERRLGLADEAVDRVAP